MTDRRPATARQPTSGVRGAGARRPLTAFFVITFGVGWPVLAVPLLADREVIATGALPAELFALAVTWFVMLPAALWVTAVSEGPGAVRHLLRRLLRWRLGAWWAAILLALPATTPGVGLLLSATGLGGSPEGTGQAPGSHLLEEHDGRPLSPPAPVLGDTPSPLPANRGTTPAGEGTTDVDRHR